MRHALAQRSEDGLYHNTMATVLANAGEFDAAIVALQRACELQPSMAEAWYNLGILLVRCVRYSEASQALLRAVSLSPKHTLARSQLADLLRVSNRPDEAIAQYRELLAEQPWSGMAWWGLADIKTLRLGEQDSAAIRAALRNPCASEDDRIAMGFALAKALDDQGLYAESLNELEQANVIARRQKIWDAATFTATVDSIQTAFTPPPPAHAQKDLGNEAIFIVGLPRSGTTLVEQILASHSQVSGAGELPDLPLVLGEKTTRCGKRFPYWVADAQAADWERLGRRYLERTTGRKRDRAIFTDKLPNNWVFIDAIRAMLPGARIILCRRDPLETCLSCYRQHLAGNEYTRTFHDLAAYWRDFDRTARRCFELYPAHTYQHVYEDLLADSEFQIRRLLAFCGLAFEPACLRFYETLRDVGTPSAMQVRQPLRRDTARAARYGPLLNPLRDALGIPKYHAAAESAGAAF